MDFGHSPQLEALIKDVREFVTTRLYPLEARYLSGGFRALLPELERLRAEVKANGWWLPHLSKDHGGLGLSLMEFGSISEELGRSPLGHYVFNCQAPDAGNMELLLEYGSPAQREQFLAPLLEGKLRSCFAMTEPEHAGSNPVWMSTKAIKHDDHWRLDGHKWFTSSADGAGFAIVMAVTDEQAPKHMRATMFLMHLPDPGFELVRNISVMGEPGEDYASHAEVRLTGVKLDDAAILGAPGAGFALAQTRLGPGRIHHCMRWIGIGERCFDLMCRRVSSRELNPGEPLGHTQFIQGWIAQSRAELDAARLMVLRTAWRIDKEGAKAAKQDISTIKFFVAGVLQRVMDRALQAHGALGMTDDTPIAYWYRHERAARIYDGPDEVHQLSLARAILKGYRPKPDAQGGQ